MFKKRNEPSHLERPAVGSIDEGMAWLSGPRGWPIATDKERRQVVKRLLWQRWQYAAEWRERGGDDDR